MKNRERIIELATEIGTTRQQLHRLEQELDRLLPEAGGVQITVQTQPRHVAGSIASRVVDLLNSHSNESFDVPAIAKRLGANNLNSLRGTVLRLAGSGRITKKKRGLYMAGGAR